MVLIIFITIILLLASGLFVLIARMYCAFAGAKWPMAVCLISLASIWYYWMTYTEQIHKAIINFLS